VTNRKAEDERPLTSKSDNSTTRAKVLYTLARKASRRSSIASWNTHINLGIGKKSGPANLNLSLNSLNSRLEAIEPPGQTVQKK
jgi:hypothetical protein